MVIERVRQRALECFSPYADRKLVTFVLTVTLSICKSLLVFIAVLKVLLQLGKSILRGRGWALKCLEGGDVGFWSLKTFPLEINLLEVSGSPCVPDCQCSRVVGVGLTLLREPEETAGRLRAEVLRVTQEVTAALGAGGGWGRGTSLSLET